MGGRSHIEMAKELVIQMDKDVGMEWEEASIICQRVKKRSQEREMLSPVHREVKNARCSVLWTAKSRMRVAQSCRQPGELQELGKDTVS